MGYAPIGARRERLGEEVQVPRGVRVEEVRVRSGGGIVLSGIVVRREGEGHGDRGKTGGPGGDERKDRRTVLVYFQGAFFFTSN